ncbi:MAG TPA: DNA-binding domain-containing protein [Bryobacteraceae bacterium]|nr:DNA-binding domain-containing protein [Bryobacteraceae bacterium]
MTLLELQRGVASAILTAAAPSLREAEAYIRPNDRLNSLERLEVYRVSYWSRVLDSLREDFPALCAILGPHTFRRLSEAYLAEVPSRSFSLRNLGSRLEEWLLSNPAFAGATPELALDAARLEWAHIEAFDAQDKKALGPEDLLEVGDVMRLGLQPYIRLVRLNYPVHRLRIRVDAGKDRRAAVKRCEASGPTALFLAVHRCEFTVFYKQLARDEFQTLELLREGAALEDALPEEAEGTTARVESWFTTWSRLGWLCGPEKKAI